MPVHVTHPVHHDSTLRRFGAILSRGYGPFQSLERPLWLALTASLGWVEYLVSIGDTRGRCLIGRGGPSGQSQSGCRAVTGDGKAEQTHTRKRTHKDDQSEKAKDPKQNRKQKHTKQNKKRLGGGGYWRLGMRLGAGVGVWECLWGRVRAVGRGEGGTPPPALCTDHTSTNPQPQKTSQLLSPVFTSAPPPVRSRCRPPCRRSSR